MRLAPPGENDLTRVSYLLFVRGQKTVRNRMRRRHSVVAIMRLSLQIRGVLAFYLETKTIGGVFFIEQMCSFSAVVSVPPGSWSSFTTEQIDTTDREPSTCVRTDHFGSTDPDLCSSKGQPLCKVMLLTHLSLHIGHGTTKSHQISVTKGWRATLPSRLFCGTAM